MALPGVKTGGVLAATNVVAHKHLILLGLFPQSPKIGATGRAYLGFLISLENSALLDVPAEEAIQGKPRHSGRIRGTVDELSPSFPHSVWKRWAASRNPWPFGGMACPSRALAFGSFQRLTRERSITWQAGQRADAHCRLVHCRELIRKARDESGTNNPKNAVSLV
jgi:hypothetical protein